MDTMQDEARYPKLIAQGSLLKVEYNATDSMNQLSDYTELFMLTHIGKTQYALINLYTGNRWNEIFETPNLVNAELVPSEIVIEHLKSPIAQITNVEVIGHISEIDFYSQVG